MERAAEWGRGAEQEVEARRGVFMLKGQFEVFSLLNLELNDYVQFLCSQVYSGIRKYQWANPFI